MKLAVLSDTHGHVANTQAAVRLIGEMSVDAVLHCGDIGSTAVVPVFSQWPTHFVLGNVDHDAAGLRFAIRRAGQTCHDRFGEIEISSRRIGFLHGDDSCKLSEAIESQQYDLVCCGHTHKAKLELQGRTYVLNPGALYRASPHTVALVELPSLRVEFRKVV